MPLDEDATVGQRIAHYRKRRGLTQVVLSGLLGRSEEWLSQIERGSRSVERLTTIVDVARVLRIEPVLLLPPPFFAKPRTVGEAGMIGTAPDWIPAIRATMMHRTAGNTTRSGTTGGGIADSAALGATDSVTRSGPVHPGALSRTIARVFRYSQTERWSDLGPVLPGLLADAHQAAADQENPETLRLLSLAYRVASGMLDRIGETHLAWIAAERASAAAERSADPLLIAGAAWRWSVVLRHTGELEESHDVPVAAARRLNATLNHAAPDHAAPDHADPDHARLEQLSVYGSLLLKGAVAAASLDDRRAMQEYLDQAEAVADRTGEDGHFWFAFGPTNVAIHRVWLDLELGDPIAATSRAESLRLDALPPHLAERRVSHLITMAWAHYLRRHDDEALTALREAKEHAPEQLLFTRRVADMLTGMLKRDRRDRRELRSLAAFAGIR